MTGPALRDWRSVRDEVLRRIRAREWAPGELIPNEADLAVEFGCARTTVNRALRAVAERGLLDRRRKAGSRVAVLPAATAKLAIPVIRKEVEALGRTYAHRLMERCEAAPPETVARAMRVPAGAGLLRVRALHLADGGPYAFEDRWINTIAVPGAADQSFDRVSSNEWLLENAPYTHGEIAFSASKASAGEAGLIGCARGAALFVLDRLTWDGAASVTKVRIAFAPGHRLRTVL